MLTGIQSSDEGQQLQSVIEMCQVKQGLHMLSAFIYKKLKTKESSSDYVFSDKYFVL